MTIYTLKVMDNAKAMNNGAVVGMTWNQREITRAGTGRKISGGFEWYYSSKKSRDTARHTILVTLHRTEYMAANRALDFLAANNGDHCEAIRRARAVDTVGFQAKVVRYIVADQAVKNNIAEKDTREALEKTTREILRMSCGIIELAKQKAMDRFDELHANWELTWPPTQTMNWWKLWRGVWWNLETRKTSKEAAAEAIEEPERDTIEDLNARKAAILAQVTEEARKLNNLIETAKGAGIDIDTIMKAVYRG